MCGLQRRKKTMGWVRNRNTVTDWGHILEGVNLPNGIQPSDIDGILERFGYFLVMEVKKPGELTSRGQEILLSALSQIPRFTVIKIVRSMEEGVNYLLNYRTGEGRTISPADFIQMVEKWAWEADRRGKAVLP
jgi:hypothetical protein